MRSLHYLHDFDGAIHANVQVNVPNMNVWPVERSMEAGKMTIWLA
jgi:hypothetical protein